MNDDEMKNLDLVEALMKRASGNETKEEGDKLDQLLSSGAISHIDMNNANDEVEAMRALLPLIDEDKEAEFPEYARERLQTKVKETFGNVEKTNSNKLSFLKFLVPIAGLAVLILALLPVSEPSLNYQFATIDLIGTVRGDAENQGDNFFPNELSQIIFDDIDKLDNWRDNWEEDSSNINVKIVYDKVNNELMVCFKNKSVLIEKNFPIVGNFEEILQQIEQIVLVELENSK
jgi:hypothetical protein